MVRTRDAVKDEKVVCVDNKIKFARDLSLLVRRQREQLLRKERYRLRSWSCLLRWQVVTSWWSSPALKRKVATMCQAKRVVRYSVLPIAATMKTHPRGSIHADASCPSPTTDGKNRRSAVAANKRSDNLTLCVVCVPMSCFVASHEKTVSLSPFHSQWLPLPPTSLMESMRNAMAITRVRTASLPAVVPRSHAMLVLRFDGEAAVSWLTYGNIRPCHVQTDDGSLAK